MEPTIEITVRAENSERVFHAVVHSVDQAIEELGRYESMAERLRMEQDSDDTI